MTVAAAGRGGRSRGRVRSSAPRVRLRFAVLALAAALGAASCGDPPSGPSDIMAELAVEPAFAAGEAPGDVGVEVDSLRVELVHGGTGEVHVDTVLAYEADDASSRWILTLEGESEPVDARMSLFGSPDTLYRGERALEARGGTVGNATLEGVGVVFLGGAVDRVEVSPGEAVLDSTGATRQFSATAHDAAGNELHDRTFDWTTSDPDVAEVDDAGLATATGQGTAAIVAAVGGVADTATVTVGGDDPGPPGPPGPPDPETSTITADPTEVAADGDAFSTITVEVFDAGGDPVGEGGAEVTLATTLGELTGVEDRGDGTYTAELRSVEDGTATVTGTLEGEPIEDEARVEFTASSVIVEPAEAMLTALEATTQLDATAFDGAGNEVAGATFAWSTSDPAVATVDDDGLVTAVSNGAARVVARLAGTSEEPADTAVVTVDQAIDRVEVSPADTVLEGVGSTAQLGADAFDANAHPIDDVDFAWNSSDPGVATVDTTGRVNAVSAGRTSVTASADGAADTASVAVAVRDSVTYDVSDYIKDTSRTERVLGSFEVPSHVPELGVEIRVEIELTFDEQRDEAFALGVGYDPVTFIGEPACPVVPDDPTIGRAWKSVGQAAMPAGETEFRARHAIEFDCYEPVDDFDQANSVHFFGIRLVYYRID